MGVDATKLSPTAKVVHQISTRTRESRTSRKKIYRMTACGKSIGLSAITVFAPVTCENCKLSNEYKDAHKNG